MDGAEMFEHESKHPPLPGHKDHHCTDLPWLVLFGVALAGMGYTQLYAYRHGNLRKLSHGFNYNKELCGVDRDEPYVYWCKDASGQGLELHYPICVSSCPQNETGVTSCYDPLTQQETRIPTYATKHTGPYCVPAKAELLMKLANKMLGQGGASRFLQIMENISEARMLLAASAALAIVIGYIYLFLLDHYAGPVVKVALFGMIMGPIAAGAYFTYYGLFAPKEEVLSLTSDAQTDLIFGISGFAIGGVFLVVACCFMGGLDTAVGCIEASCECLFQEPTLLLEPFISLTSKVLTLVVMTGGICTLASCGEVSVNGEIGIMRTFTWKTEEKVYLAYLVFMTFWLLEFGNAMSQYVLSWTTQVWYFTPYEGDRKRDVPPCGVCKGYANVIGFHLGTVALGSLLIATLRFVRLFVMALVRATQADGNCVGACIAKACVCLITALQNFLSFLNKNAYMDVAITSENFCTAASRAMGVMVQEGSVVAVLNGAQTIFQIAGMGLISGIPTFLTFIACKRLDTFSNPDSLHYVATPKWVALASMVVSAVIGVSFMIVFDTVGDTILYCFATDTQRQSVLAEVFGAAKTMTDDEASEDDEGFFGWLFGAEKKMKTDVEQFFGEPVRYTPPRLQQLIDDHQHLVS